MSARVALVNGGTDGIGRAVVDRFVLDGFRLVVFGRDDAGADRREADHGTGGVVVVRGDVARADDVDRAVAAAEERFGTVDVLCNLAAVRPVGDITETPIETWDEVFAVNVRGTFLFSRAVVPLMRAAGGGVIVNFGSPSGHGGEGHAAYCASKGAIAALTASMAMDHVADRIRVNLVVPGSTESAMNRGRDPRINEVIARRWSVTGRLNQPEEIAAVVAFLVSDGARNVSGGVFHVGVVAGEPVRRIQPG
ncbi:MAG: SDR family NAD(P)-dependent oxidoreductase [Acidimicrobiales bacterium]